MHANKKMIIRGVAIVTAATGLLIIVWGLCGFIYFYKAMGEIALVILVPLLIVAVVRIFIAAAKIVAAIGLFKCRRWGWFLSVAVLGFDSVMGIRDAVMMCIFSLNHPAQVIPESGPNAAVKVVSLWMTGIIYVISIVSVLILVQKPVRRLFDKQSDSA